MTASDLRDSVAALRLCRRINARREHACRLYSTVGVHPHDAKSFGLGGENGADDTVAAMREMLTSDELAVAVGECGLDYNRKFSTPAQQRVGATERG